MFSQTQDLCIVKGSIYCLIWPRSSSTKIPGLFADSISLLHGTQTTKPCQNAIRFFFLHYDKHSHCVQASKAASAGPTPRKHGVTGPSSAMSLVTTPVWGACQGHGKSSSHNQKARKPSRTPPKASHHSVRSTAPQNLQCLDAISTACRRST